MFEYAIVNVGVDPKYFYRLTPYEYRLIYNRFLISDATAWQHTRLITYTLYCASSDKKVELKDFLPLMTDSISKLDEPQIMTAEENMQMYEVAMQRLAQIQKQ